MDKVPMRAERNEKGDVVYFLVLCPKCNVYNRFHAICIDILSGEKTFWCNSDICRLTTHLQVVNGWAVELSAPVADLGQDKPKPTYEAVSPEAFTQQKRYTN